MSKSGKIELNDYRYLTTDYTGKMLADFVDLRQFDFAETIAVRTSLSSPTYFWSQERASRYIESIFNDKPLTPLIFQGVGSKKGDEWKIVDGYQRVLSLYFFIKGKFPKDTDARKKADNDLSKLNTLANIINIDDYSTDFTLKLDKKSEFNGKTFKDLPRNIQMKLTTGRYIRCWSFKTDKAYIQKHDLYLELLSRYNDRSVAYGCADAEPIPMFSPIFAQDITPTEAGGVLLYTDVYLAQATTDTETEEAKNLTTNEGEQTDTTEEAQTETETETAKRRGRKPLKEKT